MVNVQILSVGPLNCKKVFVIELTVAFLGNYDWAYQRKFTKYKDLKEQCVRNIEVGCQGFITNPTSVFWTNRGLSPLDKRKYIKKIQDRALWAPAWIWQSYKVTSIQQNLMVS